MINRQEAIEILNNEKPSCGEKVIYSEGEICEAYDMAIEALSHERPKGRWVNVWHGNYIATLECSVCGRRINVDYPLRERTIRRKYPYCHCGAEMVRGEEE